MLSNKRKISHDVLVSTLAFLFSIICGLLSYRILWNNLQNSEFTTWFIFFELSQFLLLLDLGFTHKFIAKNKNVDRLEKMAEINELRVVLLFAALFAVVVFYFSVFYFSKEGSVVPSLIMLGLSMFFNILSYAETAYLRTELKNIEISSVNVISQFVFIISLYSLIDEPMYAIGVSVLLRSIVVYILQVRFVGVRYKFDIKFRNYFGGSVVAINFAYFILFMVDSFVYNLTTSSVVTIAIWLVYKKYFDIVRAFWDALLPNFYVRFSYENSAKIFYAITFLCLLSYLMATALSGLIINIWLGAFTPLIDVGFAFALSFFGVTLFRITTMRLYFQGGVDWLFYLIFAIVVKLIFVLILYSLDLGLISAYVVQSAFILAGLTIWVKIKAILPPKKASGDFGNE